MTPVSLPKLIVFDLDDTLTESKTPITAENRRLLDRLHAHASLLILGAGYYTRILRQIARYPIDVMGNYGMQYLRYDKDKGEHAWVWNYSTPLSSEEIDRKTDAFCRAHGITAAGESVLYYPSGCFTIAMLGTEAGTAQKRAFDPTKEKRRALHAELSALFPEYHVFLGGTTSFDMAPRPHSKLHALRAYCTRNGFAPHEVLYCGDDFGAGGNDAPVYHSEYPFLQVASSHALPALLAPYLAAWEGTGKL